MACRPPGKNTLNQVRRRLGHAPARARGAKSTPPTAASQQDLSSHTPQILTLSMLLLLRLPVGLLSLQGFQDGAWRHGQPVHADANRLIDGVGQGR